MIGSTREETGPELMWPLSWTPMQEPPYGVVLDVVRSSHSVSPATVVRSVSLSLWTDDGGENISGMLTISLDGSELVWIQSRLPWPEHEKREA
jgi:hypothetical protein